MSRFSDTFLLSDKSATHKWSNAIYPYEKKLTIYENEIKDFIDAAEVLVKRRAPYPKLSSDVSSYY